MKKPDRSPLARSFKFAPADAPLGLLAYFDDGAKAGVVTDVVYTRAPGAETARGTALAYEITAADGSVRYLSAALLRRQQGTKLYFGPNARSAPCPLADLTCRAVEDGAEFSIFESFEMD